jgi:hypothetical protein
LTDTLPHFDPRGAGNATGVAFMFTRLGPKNLEILHELVPNATVIGVLVNPPFLGPAKSEFRPKLAPRGRGSYRNGQPRSVLRHRHRGRASLQDLIFERRAFCIQSSLVRIGRA